MLVLDVSGGVRVKVRVGVSVSCTAWPKKAMPAHIVAFIFETL